MIDNLIQSGAVINELTLLSVSTDPINQKAISTILAASEAMDETLYNLHLNHYTATAAGPYSEELKDAYKALQLWGDHGDVLALPTKRNVSLQDQTERTPVDFLQQLIFIDAAGTKRLFMDFTPEQQRRYLAKDFTTKADEYVLAFPRNQLFEQVAFTDHSALNRVSPVMVSRDWAETNEDFIQLLPSVLFGKYINGSRQFNVYQRSKLVGESRLGQKFSMTYGGHINPVDLIDAFGIDDVVRNALLREIREELVFYVQNADGDRVVDPTFLENELPTIVDNMRGVLFLDYSGSEGAVERVHLAYMNYMELGSQQHIEPRESTLIEVGFRTLAEATDYDLESWSRSLVQSIQNTTDMEHKLIDQLDMEFDGDEDDGGAIRKFAGEKYAENLQTYAYKDRWTLYGLSNIIVEDYDMSIAVVRL